MSTNKTPIISGKKWIGIDYPGWEQVCFSSMEWRYVQPGVEEDHRLLKRVGENDWSISDFWNGNGYDYKPYGEKEDMEMLEAYYQSWIEELIECVKGVHPLEGQVRDMIADQMLGVKSGKWVVVAEISGEILVEGSKAEMDKVMEAFEKYGIRSDKLILHER